VGVCFAVGVRVAFRIRVGVGVTFFGFAVAVASLARALTVAFASAVAVVLAERFVTVGAGVAPRVRGVAVAADPFNGPETLASDP
jgi:hypothetical protein